ncbi:PQQ-dependent sugar dehydrogenase [Flavihumibacter fluvii]|uniref:PQQ-dependent sugar dehydrogenase n=1 Tax=Flavihumibacter fluvii TaxID=2838157 RepID=UPI001BDED526|nr:PQQ-dependent sugar dehydrogenase [Flavihumibacter fluvii]ULQ52777.1 PQQ-dependent sugar dehydrogenase [Flavihumibacter fluvii]
MPSFAIFLIITLLSACNRDDDSNGQPAENWPSDSIRVVKNNLNFPWEILWGKDDFIWMTERGGKISKIDPKTGSVVSATVLPDVVSRGEGGLLGMVQHPDFLSNGFIFVVYNYSSGGNYREKLVRLKFAGNSLIEPVTLLDNIPASGIHNGSRLLIGTGNDPKLFITTGDASNSSQAQNANSLSGKILRLNLDGSIPADNPFAGSPIWSLGHRNPQGLVQVEGRVYASEHGPNVEDEVNIIEKGRNYGWPNVTGPCNGSESDFCTTNSVKEPIWSTGSVTLAVAGLDYYNNSRIPAWQNSLLLTTLKDATLYRHQLSADGRTIIATTPYFDGRWGRLRDICVSPAGRVYICTSNGGNRDLLVEISQPE